MIVLECSDFISYAENAKLFVHKPSLVELINYVNADSSVEDNPTASLVDMDPPKVGSLEDFSPLGTMVGKTPVARL